MNEFKKASTGVKVATVILTTLIVVPLLLLLIYGIQVGWNTGIAGVIDAAGGHAEAISFNTASGVYLIIFLGRLLFQHNTKKIKIVE